MYVLFAPNMCVHVLTCHLLAHTHTQTLAQMDACDSSVGNPNGETPVRLSSCLGGVRTHLIPIEASSEMLDSSQSYDAGNSYYFTSRFMLPVNNPV